MVFLVIFQFGYYFYFFFPGVAANSRNLVLHFVLQLPRKLSARQAGAWVGGLGVLGARLFFFLGGSANGCESAKAQGF